VVDPDNGLIASAGNAAGKDTDVDGDPRHHRHPHRRRSRQRLQRHGRQPLAGTYGSLTVDSQGGYTYVADRATALAAGATATDTSPTPSPTVRAAPTPPSSSSPSPAPSAPTPSQANPDTLAITENETQGGNVLTGAGLGGDVADLAPNGPLVVTRSAPGSVHTASPPTAP
jgi:hypothetical protein